MTDATDLEAMARTGPTTPLAPLGSGRVAGQDGDAFSRVLDAETAADAALREGRAEAQRLHQAAAAAERRVAERADRRLGRLHVQVQDRIACEAEELARAFEAERAELATPPTAAAIAAAARRLARRLAGIAAEGSGRQGGGGADA